MDIYLDQNHWIALARAYHGKRSDDGATEVARLTQKAAISRELRLPISRVHILEATKIGNLARRRRLVEAFVRFSRGWVVRPIEAVTAEELTRWARGEEAVAESAIRRGLLAALMTYEDSAKQLGLPAGEIAAEDAFGDTLDAWMYVLSQPPSVASVSGTKSAANRYAATVESVRSVWLDLPRQQRLAYYAAGVVDDVLGVLKPHSSGVAAAATRLESLTPEELVHAVSEIPTLHVMVQIGEAMARDRTRPTAPNDLWDLAYLALAIPYFDVVVTERFWAHVAASLGMERKYSCRVLGGLDELAQILTELDDG